MPSTPSRRLCRRLQYSLLSSVLCLLPPAASAQIAPDAGQSLRELQQAPLSLPPERTLDLQLPEEAAPEEAASGGQTVQVGRFKISGNSVIATDELLAQLSDFNGQTLSLGELQNAAARLTRLYRDRGYLLARAYVPAQTIEQGTVEIIVLEGRYDAIEVRNNAGLREAALAPLRRLEQGAVAQADALERALLLMNERAGVETHATLRPGNEVGTTRLAVGLDAAPRFFGRLEYDNSGNRFTGADRLTASLGVNSPLGLGDRADLRVLGTREDQLYYQFAYELPLGPWGTSLGAGYSYMEYELGKDFEDLEAHGTTHTRSVFVNQPLIVSRKFWLNTRLQYERRRLTDEMDLFGTREKKRAQVTALSLEGNARDSFLGGGVTSFAVSWRHGKLALGAEERAIDALTARTHGSFNVIAPTLVRLQRLNDRFSLFLRLRGQWADGNLDGSEKMGLGGMYGVRAYPQGEAQGDDGWVGNLELRYALTPQWQLSTFVDHGRIQFNHKAWDDGKNHRSLSAAGIGAAWASEHWRLDASAAWKLGNERPQSDTRHQTPRIWVQAAYLF
ncbi:MAG: ShlB/FhaC/HecB family hemolysin secretion/activation protein [Zoogloeaceae bacterium]|jgi:hemolysin activation/secretion protein|nr:ShlB/FhaC/HecB family hemolysin secretion/activation protein [Zoogloeaceae bacterium]